MPRAGAGRRDDGVLGRTHISIRYGRSLRPCLAAPIIQHAAGAHPEEGSMTITPAVDLQKAAKEHLWMHFTRMGEYATHDVPIIVRGEGCYLEDANGKRYLDALAGLFSVNIGYLFGGEI